MSSKHRLTRSFRTLSAIIYLVSAGSWGCFLLHPGGSPLGDEDRPDLLYPVSHNLICLSFSQLNTIVALHFASHAPFSYLHFLVGTLTALTCLTMFCVAVEAPKLITDRIERSKFGEVLFTFRGRYIFDILIALYLFSMPPWGFLCAVSTLSLIFGIRFLGVKQPDAFNEIFRQSDVESQGDSYTMESEYDTPVVERR